MHWKKKKIDPLLFLTVKQLPTYDASVIKGEILNHSRYTTYAQISLQIVYLSGYGMNIGSERVTYFPEITPCDRGRYAFEIHPPPPPQYETKDILVRITRAAVIE